MAATLVGQTMLLANVIEFVATEFLFLPVDILSCYQSLLRYSRLVLDVVLTIDWLPAFQTEGKPG